MQQKISPECIDLISKMMLVDTKKRWSAVQLLSHGWFQKMLVNKEGISPVLDKEVIAKLQAYQGLSVLKRSAIEMFIKTMDPKDIAQL